MPQSIEFTSDFGHFFIKYTQTAGELDLDEELKTDGALVPASDYQKVKTFFDHCNGADHQQAVLVKN